MFLTRREFTQLIAASALLPSSTSLRASEAEKNKLKLGLVTYNWGKNWTIPTLIENCEATGFTGVELRSTHRHGVEIEIGSQRRKEVRQQFEASDVQLVGLGSACEYHSSDPQVVKKNIEETKAFVKLCHDVGGSGVKVRPNGLPKNVPVEKTLEQIGQSLNLVGRFAADYDVQIRVEVHGRETSKIPYMQKIMEIANHPNVVVCWNCNPTDLIGAGLESHYQSLADRMGTIHIHDLRNQKYPWDELFPLLKQTDAKPFTGWTLLEEGSVPDDIVGAMHENRKIWKQLVR